MRDVLLYINDNGDSLVLSTSNLYVVETITGANGNTVDVSTAQGVGQVGATVQSQVVQPVSMTITGQILSGFRAEVYALAERMQEVILPGVSARLYHNGTYYRIVVPTATPVIETVKRWPHFQFTLLAAYPYWMRDLATKTILTGVIPRFKFPWNISQSYRFGEIIETAFINITNEGQIPCPFTVVFAASGPATNPRIVNVITGEVMQLNRVMTAGERVTVEVTHDLTYVTSTIDGDIRGDLDIGNDLWRMAVGDNLIKPEADSGGSNVIVSIDRSIEKVGIVIC